jgi:hypothetical protein
LPWREASQVKSEPAEARLPACVGITPDRLTCGNL